MAGETMSAEGWVKLWRRLEDSDIWELPPTTIKIWIWLLMHANHEARTVYGIEVQPGELITSYDSICKGIAWKEKGGRVTTTTPNQVRWAIKCLEARQTLQRYPHQQHLHLKVLNWSKFQSTTSAPQQSNDRPHDGLTTDLQQTYDTKQEERIREDKKEEVVVHDYLLDFALNEIPDSESTAADYRAVIDRHKARLDDATIERVMSDLANWTPPKPRKKWHLTLNKWLLKEEPQPAPPESPYPTITDVPATW